MMTKFTQGFYRNAEAVGWLGWIETDKGHFFITLDGDIRGPFADSVPQEIPTASPV
jgi:hypothetical protein